MNLKKVMSNSFVYIMVFACMLVSVHAVADVNLGTAGNFVVLAKSGISTTGTTAITGDIGVSPIDATAITGFGLIMDSSNQFATSSMVTGKAYAADYSHPTPTVMTTAISDMELAYTDAAGKTLPDYTELGAGNIDGMTLSPGLYKWGTGVTIPTGVTLSGSANDIWVFQIAQDLTVGNGAIVTLSGGAQAKNIFWQVSGEATLGTTAVVYGNILSETAIVFNTGATLHGRALAKTAVTLDAAAVSLPDVVSSSPPVTNPGSGTTSSSGGSSTGGSSSEGSAGGTPVWDCSAWSTCNASGIRTKTCAQKNSSYTSKESQACSPVQTSTGDTTPAQNNTAQTPAAATNTNGITSQGLPISGNESSPWWIIALVILVVTGAIIGGYAYFTQSKSSKS